MKRRELERCLRIAGYYLKREGGSHAFGLTQKRALEAISRHTEIKEPLARKILKNLGAC